MTNLFALLTLASATSNFSGTKVSTDTAWAQIDNYIHTHATSGDQATIDRIHGEALLGMETWELVSGSAASQTKISDGLGMGWPQNCQVLTFTSSQDALTLAAMIDVYVTGSSLFKVQRAIRN